MSDERFRELEREHAKGLLSLERLQDERLRIGRGWHGESVPLGVRIVREERGVYAKPIRIPEAGGPVVEVQLVYVPGGEVECDCDHGVRHNEGWRERDEEPESFCHDCRGAGRRTIAPFYCGRFPVTWEQHLAFATETQYHARLGDRLDVPFGDSIVVHNWANPSEHLRLRRPDMLHHPVVNVTLEDAIAFCAWTRLRLLTATEWKWAALGRPIRPLSGRHGLPSYPWGNEPPSPERCVWAGHPEFGLQQLGRPYRQHEASTAPVVVPETIDDAISRLENVGARPGPRPVLLPARPLGASWVEAHDLCGNVWELIESDPNNPLVLGGSFRSVGESLEESLGSVRVGVPVGPRISPDQDDSTGYRVALSAVT